MNHISFVCVFDKFLHFVIPIRGGGHILHCGASLALRASAMGALLARVCRQAASTSFFKMPKKTARTPLWAHKRINTPLGNNTGIIICGFCQRSVSGELDAPSLPWLRAVSAFAPPCALLDGLILLLLLTIIMILLHFCVIDIVLLLLS